MFSDTPMVVHTLSPSRGVDEHPGHGPGPLAGVEDPYPVVDQVDGGELGEVRADGLAQGRVEGVDRAVALGRGQHAARRRRGPSPWLRSVWRPRSANCWSAMTRNDSSSKNSGSHPVARRSSSSSEPSATSKW